MRSRTVHWIWIGSPPPARLILNLSRFRELDRAGNFRYVVWCDRPWPRPVALHAEGLEICQISDLFTRLQGLPLVGQLHAALRREANGPLRNYAAASDILRYVVMWIYGGIYLDADVQLTNMDNLLRLLVQAERSNLILMPSRVSSRGRGYINGAILCRRQHPFWRQVFTTIADRYRLDLSYGAKRAFDDEQDKDLKPGELRMKRTMQFSGIDALWDADGRRSPGTIVTFNESECFAPIDATGRAFRLPPPYLRRASMPG